MDEEGSEVDLQIALAEVQLGIGVGAVKLSGQFLHCGQWVFIHPVNNSEVNAPHTSSWRPPDSISTVMR